MKRRCTFFTVCFLVLGMETIAYATPVALRLQASIDTIEDNNGFAGSAYDLVSIGTTFDFNAFWESANIVPAVSGDYNNVGITTDLEIADITSTGSGWMSGPFSVNGYGTSSSGQMEWLSCFAGAQDVLFSVNLVDMTFLLGSAPVTGYSFQATGQLRPINAVPEPSAFFLFGAGVIGLVGCRRKQILSAG